MRRNESGDGGSEGEAGRTIPSWAVTPAKISAAVRRMVRVAKPSRVVLFGSAVRSGAGAPRDADFLIISQRAIKSPRKESVRIRRALRGIVMPMDILLISERQWRNAAMRPGLVYREALRDGKVIYDAKKDATSAGQP